MIINYKTINGKLLVVSYLSDITNSQTII